MTATNGCPRCGAPITEADRFCGDCGAVLGAQRASDEGNTGGVPSKAPQKTMLGMSPAVAPQAAPPGSKAAPQKTLLGVASPLVGGAASAAARAAQGTPSAWKPPEPEAPRLEPPRSAAGHDAKRTLVGMSPLAQPSGEPTAAAPSASARKPESADAARSPAKLAAKSERTMLGITPLAVAPADPGSVSAAASPEALPTHGESRSALQNREAARPRSFTPPEPVALAEPSVPPVGAPRWLWLAIGALGVLAIAGGVFAWLSSRGPALSVRVLSIAGVETLEVEAPGSPPHAKLRFMGVEKALEAGRARFPLRADALKIGDNRLAIDLVERSGDVTSSSVELNVTYRVRLDTAPLANSPPALRVVVDAIPSSQVMLADTPLALDAHGHGERDIPVAHEAAGTFSFAARYQITQPGEPPEQGKLELVLPVTTMQIDRPGPETVTEQNVVELAGAVEPGAVVDVNGAPVKELEGRFLHRVELAAPGEYALRVTARTKGKAPKLVELKVTRVENLMAAAAGFEADPSLNYARIAPNPAIYRGQKVSFDGRVYNVEIESGKSILQMLVLDCPGKSRCPLWVEYPQATEATLDSWVRVLGVIAGEQQFRSKQDRVQTVPSVHAQYVLKLAR